MTKKKLLPNDIEGMIYLIRDQRVMLDADLATLYRVETKVLNRQVKRNINRFPVDFMFQLDDFETTNLRCQKGTSSLQYGGRVDELHKTKPSLSPVRKKIGLK